MAAPHVAGVTSLLYSINPALKPADVQTILESTVTAFPAGSTCDTSNCGTGIVNAAAAVTAVSNLPPYAPVIAPISNPDGDGNYIFPSMSEGEYFIRAFAESYVVSSKDQITVGVDETVAKDISLTPGTTTLVYNVTNWRNYYGKTAGFGTSIGGSQYNERYLVVTAVPPGAELLDISNNGFLFTPTLGGDYSVVSVVTDLNDVVKEDSMTVEMVNHPTEAFPSIIPGPSELPLLYDGVVYADSRGTVGVRPGEKVCFRGW